MAHLLHKKYDALCMKGDILRGRGGGEGGGAHFVQVVIQSKLILSKVQSLDKNIQDVCNII